ncbi:histone deacetylase 8 [Epithele typhae]|uniref:histone deacetylase 8 n=1 Tax=Epithele typhae TaxID=378194 RepID=UPI0020077D24|nr:histone deacetylase 8 [Epithele typhae]KAH9941299.1 histone deacetylase 8 [Epithele typhae]
MQQTYERRVGYVVSNDLVKVSSLLPSNKNRSLLVHSLVKAFGLLSTDDAGLGVQSLPPSPAEFRELSAYHDRDFLEHVLKEDVSTEDDANEEFGLTEASGLGSLMDCPPFPQMRDYVKYVAGASLTAAKALKEDKVDIAICWDGGRHHAQKAQASGFCYVADCVLAILALKRPQPSPDGGLTRPRVMYLDLDLHFSDGVSHAFHRSAAGSSSPQVLTLSLARLSDPSDAGFDPFTLALPLERGAGRGAFARVWPLVERVRAAFRPDCVVVQCGADGLAGDPYATWNWSIGDGEGSMGWCVDRVCGWGCKVLLLGGGGYRSPNVARAWTYLTSVALGRPLPLDADIPDHGAFPLYAPHKNRDEYLVASKKTSQQ